MSSSLFHLLYRKVLTWLRNKRKKVYLFLLASCSGGGSVDISDVTLATVWGDPSLGVLVELLGFSFSSTGEVLGFEEGVFSFDTADGFESSLTVFSTPFVTIFSTGVLDTLGRLRDRFGSFGTCMSLLLSPSSSESDNSSWGATCLSDARTVRKKKVKKQLVSEHIT